MQKATSPFLVLMLAVATAVCSAHAASLQEATTVLGAANIKSIEFSGSGRWFQFGQAPNPNLPWPQFDVSSYTASINYDVPSSHVQIVRKQTIEPGRQRPVPIEQKPEFFLSGVQVWNLAPPPNSPPGAAPVATAQPAALEERATEIWATPQGFLKAALANNAKSEPAGENLTVSFTAPDGKHHYAGTINARNQVERVRTWIDNPVLGDTSIETSFSDYKDFGGVQFPARITRVQGGYPVLDLNIAAVKPNPAVEVAVPQNLASAPVQTTVAVNKLADGVYYLTGGTHHSVAIEQRDHVVLVEAPLNEERSLVLIDKINELIPNKPIKYVVNSHVHFDHTGGLRTFVDADAVIVTPELDKPYFEKAWAAPHALNPDRLSKSQKPAKFETFSDKYVLADGSRSIEIHKIAGNGHSDELALVYLPAEKILIEADAYTPAAPNTPPAVPNPYSVLYENIQKLKLDVSRIAALHGPGIVTLADLHTAIGQQATQ